MPLDEQKCEKITGETRCLSSEEIAKLMTEVPGWSLKDKAIEREFKFADFREAMAFVNRLAVVAQAAGHHPDIFISYNLVRLTNSTHKIGGLSMNDFILAAKINQLVQQ